MTVKKMSVFILIAAVLFLGITGCSDSDTLENQYKDKSVVVNLQGGDWGYPTPFSHYSRGPGIYKMTLIFDSLLERGEKGYIPWLAKEWTVSEDGCKYTFILRENIKWHDGIDLTAEDVVFSFKYYEKHPPVFNDLTVDGETFIKSVKAIDTHTIEFEVERPVAFLLGKIGNTRIIPKHIWEGVEDPVNFNGPEAVIGSGPYILTYYSREQGAYKFEAFKDFWGPGQRVDVIKFIPVSDNILAFDRGEIDITGVSPDVISKYSDENEYTIIKNPAFWGYRLIFNMEKRPELLDVNVRKAFAHAIDKNELIEKVARNAAVPASPGYLPIHHIWYNDKVVNYEFDIEKAKDLMNGRKLSFTLLTGNSNEEVKIAELIKINLERAGIDIIITSVDTKTRDGAIKNGNYEIVLNGHGGWGGDPDILRTTYANGRIRGYSNDEINELSERQLYEMDVKKRKDIIYKLQEVIGEEVPMLPLYNTTGYCVFRHSKYDGWKYMFDHHEVTHNKLSYLDSWEEGNIP
ncbi:ABC transporter substrate-binding protein [Acetivibrio saccincola]|uniref:Periplasmic dipeptide transport protein n=1 Tax=Acetivibrio saccincola TaxID=1677857 RepID=A0A2K9EHK5_9FIRM|nr:ABC transporter substrate-binding protein [Acetivibrio saccincola]AUG58695.1 Periplasmic dipeptide transport protein precursor [Acetivibrio saccincola]